MTDATSPALSALASCVHARLEERGQAFLQDALAELAGGVEPRRLGMLLGLASRHARGRTPLAATQAEVTALEAQFPGWDFSRWDLLVSLRVALLLAHQDLGGEGFLEATEHLFPRADEGEQRALYRAVALAPEPERFRWRLQDGCRTNIVPVFEAIACDSPVPAAVFDDVGWKQLCIKAVFIGAPLWRVTGLDGRLDEDLARMALDLVEERRSAGREIQPDLWLLLSAFDGGRALPYLLEEIQRAEGALTEGSAAALLALGRAGARAELERHGVGELEPLARQALAGDFGQKTWGDLPGRAPTAP